MKYTNGTSIIYELRKMMVSLGFIKNNYNNYINHQMFYRGLKEYWGSKACIRKYNGRI